MSPIAHRQLVLVRHGQSRTNRENRFTGCLDPPLTGLGCAQAQAAGRWLATQGTLVTAAYASLLLRAVSSCGRILDVLDRGDLRIRTCAGLVERDYGSLNGLTRAEAEARWGGGLVRQWRRSYSAVRPGEESLRDTAARVVLAFLRDILPAVMGGPTLVVAHGNSLRALMMALDGLTPEEVETLEMPPGALRVYEFADDGRILDASRIIMPTTTVDPAPDDVLGEMVAEEAGCLRSAS
ncbi:2,3-bisphosphoglycerate-dependent phosphoglycerate mutase [Methylobacterium sp. C25]|uniref:2,3-bisphosphoglycerate-dependent phosphoglycerate mutase n=1 Tax=Methylobacterium sp. C25 TaxID=2721622 RepID=UPI001F2F6F0D|nr:2,3-bisphosphoglycerate-dependent phosphoglycerate mutase [Methylobacterium sp. C25]MCE4224969.1 2,3-bisphosphoglycerate-dependent phosphoglycerate mutase [Methylobacterium sp. C25]